MSRMIFVNLPVRDIGASRRFFSRLGFDFNPQFSDDHTLCMVVADNIFVMMLEEQFFKTFINGEVSDAHTATEVLTCLSAGSRAEIDEMVAQAIEAGGKPWKEPLQQDGMYGGSFQDLDGHVWELVYMEQPGQD
ncbi:MAG: VOC family protein [Actinomycetota bacterium]|nr:VOC family protein [Actinomycetota bacterium]